MKTTDLSDEYPDARICQPVFSCYGGRKQFHGKIQTVECFEDNTYIRKALSTRVDGDVLVVDAGGSPRCAMLGDRMAQLGIDNGWSGVVINGLIRDSLDISQMPFGVKALGTLPLKSVKEDIGKSNVPVTFAGVLFAPGHYLYADEDGIIVSDKALSLLNCPQ